MNFRQRPPRYNGACCQLRLVAGLALGQRAFFHGRPSFDFSRRVFLLGLGVRQSMNAQGTRARVLPEFAPQAQQVFFHFPVAAHGATPRSMGLRTPRRMSQPIVMNATSKA